MPIYKPPDTFHDCVRDAYRLRQSVERRLLLNTFERAKLELILKRLDDEFAGEAFIDDDSHDPTDNDSHHKKETKQ